MRKLFYSATLVLVLVAFMLPSNSAKAVIAPANVLVPGQFMNRGDTISANNFHLTLQLDGNLVEYNSANQPVWYTGIMDPTANKLILQNDGNLVLYNSSNLPVWYSGTAVSSVGKFSVQDDGNLVIYDGNSNAVWAKANASTMLVTNTIFKGQTLISGLSGYFMALQNDGNLVLYNASHQAIWTPGVYDPTANRLAFQQDGNFVLYNTANAPVWSSKTRWPNYVNGQNLAVQGSVVVQSDGNLVMYDVNGMPVWHR